MNSKPSFSLPPSKPLRGSRLAMALKGAVLAALLAAALTPVLAQEVTADASAAATAKKPVSMPGTLVIPASSRVNAEDKGVRAHTNIRFIAPSTSDPMELPPYSGYAYETPASLACVYNLVTPVVQGCSPNMTTATPEGGGQTIAIVDAYDDPQAASDLAYFSDQFGIPFSIPKFNVVYASGSQPAMDSSGGWELEESLDIEYAHAMAPKAKLFLVEAASNSFSDLFQAVAVATNLVVCGKTELNFSTGAVGSCPANSTGYGEVSMSWGGSEFSGETAYDAAFTTPHVVYFASAGDSAGVIYPSASPNVLSAGGTSTARSLTNGQLLEEIAWSDAGGGLSSYEARPVSQSAIGLYPGAMRATPDLSADSNPNTGVWLYDSVPVAGYDNPSNWWTVGGTSVASPTLAGIVNAAEASSSKWAASTAAELTAIYAQLPTTKYAADFNDITYGACNYYSSSFSGKGYDLCTGLGSPKGLAGK